MQIERITPLVITFNEERNIRRTLDALVWAKHIVVIDSGSSDRTLEIVAEYPQAEVIYHPFSSFADQCNFGHSCIRTDWVLSLDADYELTDELIREIKDLEEYPDVAGYRAAFIYRLYGEPLRGTIYPPRTVLYKVRTASYYNEGHGHRVAIDGQVRPLLGKIFHDDRKPLSRWFSSQQRYAEAEAAHLLNSAPTALSWADRVRLAAWPAPLLIPFYVLFVKGCILDGWVGWFYALQRLLAEIMLALTLIERRWSR